MEKSEKNIISYAVVVNIVHVIVCLLFYGVRLLGWSQQTVFQLIFFSIEILVWFIGSIMFGLGMKITKIKDGLIYALISLLPIFILTGIGAIIGFTSNPEAASWIEFFFIGSAINFWHRPAILLAKFLSNSAYLLFAVNIGVLFMVSLLGVNYAISANRMKNKKKKLKKEKDSVQKPDVAESVQ